MRIACKDIYGASVTVVMVVENLAHLSDGTLAHITKLFVDGRPLSALLGDRLQLVIKAGSKAHQGACD